MSGITYSPSASSRPVAAALLVGLLLLGCLAVVVGPLVAFALGAIGAVPLAAIWVAALAAARLAAGAARPR